MSIFGKRIYGESLTELVFQNRNKAYGAYLLYRRSPRYLVVSILLGTLLFLLIFLSSFFYYLSGGPELSRDDYILYEVEYMPINPPVDDELEELARAYVRPEEEKTLAPVVSDTVKEVIDEKPDDEVTKTEEEESQDTVSGKPGGALHGTGEGEVSGLATVIDVFPRYPGGEDARLLYLKRNTRYPEEAMKAGIQGVVVVLFVVERDGSLSNISIERGIGGGCDEEAIRVVKNMARWEPGKRQGKPVRVILRMPVVFRRLGV